MYFKKIPKKKLKQDVPRLLKEEEEYPQAQSTSLQGYLTSDSPLSGWLACLLLLRPAMLWPRGRGQESPEQSSQNVPASRREKARSP